MAYGDNANDPFLASIQSYAPLSSGQSMPYLTGLEGLPGMDNPLMGMAMQPLVSRFMGMSGMAAMGMNDRNIKDTLDSQRFWSQQYSLQQQMAKLDTESVVNTARGMAALSGTPWGAEQMRSARSAASLLSSVGPIAAMVAPDLLEQMGGQRGSALNLSSQMMQANRYRIDPVTGMMGVDAKSVATQAEELFKSLYGEHVDLDETRGFTAGQLGGVYNQLSMRGILPGSLGPRDTLTELAKGSGQNQSLLRQAARNQGVQLQNSADGSINIDAISSADIQKLTKDDNLAGGMRGFDSARVSKTIKGYLDTLNAVRDVFGDMGRPNAPMAELVNAMEAMTNGASGQLAPGKMNTMIRQTQLMAKTAGVDLNTAIAMQGHASQLGQEFGLSPLNAVSVTQGSLGYLAAAKAMGITPAWGRDSADQLAQLDTGLRTRAAASQTTNRMAYVLRLDETTGGFKAGSEAAEYVKALKAGQDTFTFNKQTRSTLLDDSDLRGMLQSADLASGIKLGLDSSEIQAGLSQVHRQEEFNVRYNLQDISRRSQLDTDVKPLAASLAQNALSASLRRHGVSAAAVSAIQKQAAAALTDKTFDMDDADFASDEKRGQLMGQTLRDSMAGSAAMGELNKTMSVAQQDQFFRNAADSYYGSLDTAMRTGNFTAIGGAQNAYLAYNRRLNAASSSLQQQNLLEGRIRNELAPLNRGTMLSRAMGYLQNVREGDSDQIMRGVATALGGVDEKTIRDKIMPLAGELEDKQRELAGIQGDFKTVRPEDRAGLEKKFNAGLDTLHNLSTRMGEIFSGLGVSQDSVTDRDSQMALNWGERVGKYTALMKDPAFAGDPDNRKIYEEAIRQQGETAETLAVKTLGSKTALNNMGTRGVQAAGTIQDTNEQLRELALIHTGGDVAALMSGNYQGDLTPEQKKQLDAQVSGLTGSRDSAVKSLDGMIKAGGRQWDAAGVAADLNAAGQSVKLEDVQHARMLDDTDLATIKKNEDRQASAKAQLAAGKSLTAGEQTDLEDANASMAGYAKKLGVSGTVGVDAAVAVYDKISATGEGALAKANKSPLEVAKAMLKSFGISADSDDPQLTALAAQASTETGNAMMQGITAGENKLIAIGKSADRRGRYGKYGDVDTVEKDYRDAVAAKGPDQAAKLKAFRGKYGMTDAAFDTFKSDYTAVNSGDESIYAAKVHDDYSAIAAEKDPTRRAAAEKAFRGRYALTDDKKYASFKQTVDAQEKSGLGDFGSIAGTHRTHDKISDAVTATDAMLHGGKQAPPVVNVTYPDKITVTLLDGDKTRTGTAKVDSSANSGGVMHVPTGGH